MRWGICASLMIAVSGCHALSVDVDGMIAHRAIESIDAAPTGMETEPGPQKLPDAPSKDKSKQSMVERLQLGNIPGANVPDIRMPSATAPRAEIEAAIKKQFPPLPKLPALPLVQQGPNGMPLTLADLQQMALRTNPLIRQAHLNVEGARGIALQAGLYPNPVIGYEGSTIGQGGAANETGTRTPGQQGAFVEQTIKIAGKLTLSRAAALAEVGIAEERLKQTEADLQAQVRTNYFAVLSARTNFEVLSALIQSADELYSVLLLQMEAGEVAGYEPMQIRVLALQARGQLVHAHNRYVAAWKQLAATLGVPGMPLTAIAGRIDIAVPQFDHDHVLAYVLENHTEIQVARIGVERARMLLRLAEIEPFPDVTLRVAVQKDYTTPPFGAVANVSVGVPFPLWNRNQGNIQHAGAMMQHALQEQSRVRNELSNRAAEIFERYENNRYLLDLYKKQILSNQVQAFRAAVARHAALGVKDVSYNDLVTAQQSLSSVVGSYLVALNDQWISVVDIAHLLQTKDLFQVQHAEPVAPIPDVPLIMQEERRQLRK